MSMSTFVVGFRDPTDPHHLKMLAVYSACKEANVLLPDEVAAYFDPKGFGKKNPHDIPKEECIEVDLGAAQRPWKNDMSQGFEVDLAKLPEGVKVIRFFNSW